MSNIRYPDPPPKGVIGARINCISKIMRMRFNEIINEEGLFWGQQHILMLLKDNDGITISQLAEHLGIAAATASISIKRMEKSGFICRREDEKDARISRLYLTEQSKAILEHIKEKIDEQEKELTKTLSDEEIDKLSDLLDGIIREMIKKEDSIND